MSRLVCLLALSVVGALVTSSCLTPDFKFSDDPSSGTGGGNDGGAGSTAAHCDNRKTDADETDIDCGGLDCGPCAIGRVCKASSDCDGVPCTDGMCRAASCTDDLKTGDETDVDCGGSCPGCATNKRCEVAKDCESSVCTAGKCAAPSCSDRVKNGDESDIDCGGGCDPCEVGGSCVVSKDCEQPPVDVGGSAACSDDGLCYLKCQEAYLADCNEKAADGCEADVRSDAAHCGVCGTKCDLANTKASKCADGVCEIDFDGGGCRDNYDDCNGMHSDGCEASLNTDADNCGACNEVCSDKNGTPSCSTGLCTIDCATGFDDCDDDAKSNGCEVNLETSVLHCGVCNNDCSPAPGQSASCDTSKVPACQSIACDAPGDCGGVQPCGACDSDQACNDKLNTTTNCGGCGIVCAATNATTSCTDQGGGTYGCGILSCVDAGDTDWENCDGYYGNGCESNVKVDVNNCGGCASSGGQDCAALKNNAALNIASINCTNGGCVITGCKTTYVDCDGNPNNGCEVNKATDDARCGGCLASDPKPGGGENCDTKWPHASGTCTASACVFDSCADSNWGDCNSNTSDGCETDLRTSASHCGSCGSACQVNSATKTNTCSSKTCTAVCESFGGNCDGNQRNGCENLNTSSQNCGSCGNTCGGDGTGVSSASCGAGACNVSCGNGMCPDSTSEAACTVPLHTTSNCSYCGEVCGVSNPYCTASGCLDHLQIELVSASTTATGHTSGTLTFSHNLQTARATNNMRTVVISVGYSGNLVNLPASVTYSGQTATLARALASGNQAWVGIYYVLDAQLPAGTGNKTVNVAGDVNNTNGFAVRVYEFINVDQSSPLGPVASKSGQQGCSSGTESSKNTSVTLSGLSVDSWVVSQFAIYAAVTTSVGGSQTAEGQLTVAGVSTNSGYTDNISPSTTVQWGCGSSVQQWSHAAVALQPEGTD